jgi:DNA-binding LacI/PurR family transcriptional regulator
MRQKTTIKDVAREAGVSVATVSRVLSRTGYYDEDTARKVRAAVQVLGYRRNVHWQRLSQNASRTICFLLGNRPSLNSMQTRILVACERVCQESGYELVFSHLEYGTGLKPAAVPLPRMLAEEGLADGAILIGRHSANLLQVLGAASFPWVLLGNNYEGVAGALRHNTVSYDDEAGCFEAASYLARLGHRHIAFCGNLAVPWFARRHSGFARAARQHGFQALVAGEDWNVRGIEYGRLAAAEMLRRADPPTAILASNDEIAAGVWKELAQRGLRIPREMSLCGFGDREEFQILEPSLTTIAVFPENLGDGLARMLLGRLEHPESPAESRMHPCQLVERASCAPPVSRRRRGSDV